MNPKENVRNNDLIRNVILDELVEVLAGELNTDEEVVVLHQLLCEGHPLLSVLRRLAITPPSTRKVAGLALVRAVQEK